MDSSHLSQDNRKMGSPQRPQPLSKDKTEKMLIMYFSIACTMSGITLCLTVQLFEITKWAKFCILL